MSWSYFTARSYCRQVPDRAGEDPGGGSTLPLRRIWNCWRSVRPHAPRQCRLPSAQHIRGYWGDQEKVQILLEMSHSFSWGLSNLNIENRTTHKSIIVNYNQFDQRRHSRCEVLSIIGQDWCNEKYYYPCPIGNSAPRVMDFCPADWLTKIFLFLSLRCISANHQGSFGCCKNMIYDLITIFQMESVGVV